MLGGEGGGLWGVGWDVGVVEWGCGRAVGRELKVCFFFSRRVDIFLVVLHGVLQGLETWTVSSESVKESAGSVGGQRHMVVHCVHYGAHSEFPLGALAQKLVE